MEKRTICEDCKHLEVVDKKYEKYTRCNAVEPPLYMFGKFDPSKQIRLDCPLNNVLP